jgi:hypothetical protein
MQTSQDSSQTDKAKPEFISKFTKGYRFEPARIEYEATQEKLTGEAGMGSMVDLFTESRWYEALRDVLPVRQSNYSYDSIQYALSLITGFWLGAECLEDVEKYKRDCLLVKKLGGDRGKIPTAKSIGNWLRDFDGENLAKLNGYLSRQALSYRRHLKPETPLVLDMDSTSHPQSGTKMEGVAWNYKNEWALDSLSCFDDMGFCYGFELRGGSTYSSQGASEMLEKIVQEVRSSYEDWEQQIYYRADSAFCNEEVLRTCLRLGLKFTITAHGNLRWENELKQLAESDWQGWEYSLEERQQAAARRRVLPRVEVAQLLYTPSWATNIRFKLVVKREWQEFEEDGLLAGQGYWHHYGVLTNVMDYLESAQAIMEHHMQRGNAENRIKALKGDYDLRHMPCLKLNANFAYGLLGMVALNFHRALSLVEDPKCPRFSKSFRQRLIRIPGRLVSHARALKIKIEEHWLREVERLRKAWLCPPKNELTFKLRYQKA